MEKIHILLSIIVFCNTFVTSVPIQEVEDDEILNTFEEELSKPVFPPARQTILQQSDLDSTMLNQIELELFSKLLSPNDTTLQQGTKSLLAKYIIAQILNDNKRYQASPTSGSNEIASIATEVPLKVDPEPKTMEPIEESTTKRQAPVGEKVQTFQPAAEESTISWVTRGTPAPAHVLGQVDKILGNVATGNIIGIVDESLAIRAPTPVRNLVNGILQLVFCNPVDRLMNRCRGASGGAGSVPIPPSGLGASSLPGLGATRRPIFGR